jgi:hypothetical protein
LLIIIEGYILICDRTFWDTHASTFENIIILLVGNLSTRGSKYLNLVFEVLLKRFPMEGAMLLLSSGPVSTMLTSCAESYNKMQQSEPIEVIQIYLSTLSRIILALPAKLNFILDLVETKQNFGVNELVSS